MLAPDSRHGEFQRRQVGEHFLPVLAQLTKFRVGKLPVIVVCALPRRKNVHHFLRPDRHHGPEHHPIDEREDRRVHPDGERQSNDRDDGEPRRFDQLPKREAKILDHTVGLFCEMRKAPALDSAMKWGVLFANDGGRTKTNQGRRFPAASSEQTFSIRRLWACGSLAESIQLIKSRRSIGVRSLH